MAEAILGDRKRIILTANVKVVVKKNDPIFVFGTSIISFIFKGHVVGSKRVFLNVLANGRLFVPEIQIALVFGKVDFEDAAEVVEAMHELTMTNYSNF